MIEYNIFSNIVSDNLDELPIYTMLESAIEAFHFEEGTPFNIYIHPLPYASLFYDYCDAIAARFPSMKFHFHRTKGLADGYRMSLINAKTPYVFQMEHDWQFISDTIHHSLSDICHEMKQHGLDQVNFSARTLEAEWTFKPGKKRKKERIFTHTQHPETTIPLCTFAFRGNASALIDVNYFKKHFVRYINPLSYAAYGVEEVLSVISPSSHLYGSLNHPPTVMHLDGKKLCKKTFCTNPFKKWIFHRKKQKGKTQLLKDISWALKSMEF